MSMTAAQILTIRRRVGDNNTDNATPPAYELSDTVLNAIYDDSTLGDSDIDRTTVWAIVERLGMAVNHVSSSGELSSKQHNQKYEQLERLLDKWLTLTGISITATSSISVVATNTYRADSRQTEEPDYTNGTADDGDRYIIINY